MCSNTFHDLDSIRSNSGLSATRLPTGKPQKDRNITSSFFLGTNKLDDDHFFKYFFNFLSWAEFCRLIYLYRRDYFSGAYFPNPVEFFARYYFLIMLLAFVIRFFRTLSTPFLNFIFYRGLILNDFDHTKEALYHW